MFLSYNFVYIYITASMLMVSPSDSSRTWIHLKFHSPIGSQWGFIRVFGMVMNGQQEAVRSKQIGVKLLSQLPIGTSVNKLVFGPPAPPGLIIPAISIHGWQRSWMQKDLKGWCGCRRITWFTTIALTQSDSLRDSLLNVLLKHRRKFYMLLNAHCHHTKTSRYLYYYDLYQP